MLDADTTAFLEGGRGLLVGVVSADGTPCIARAWGLSVVTPEPPTLRLLVPADDAVVLDALVEGAQAAVTAGHVRTYRAIQLKGRSLGVEATTDRDRVRCAAYIDAFFTELVEINMLPREMCTRFAPVDVAACNLVIDALYDQTPGPGAGAKLVTRP